LATQKREIEVEARLAAEQRRAAEAQATELRRAIVRRERALAVAADAERRELQSVRGSAERWLRWVAGPGFAAVAAAGAASIAAFRLWNTIDLSTGTVLPAERSAIVRTAPVPAPLALSTVLPAEDAEPVELRMAVELASLAR